MVRQYKPTPEERDERVNTEAEPEELVRRVLRAGPHPEAVDKKKVKRDAEPGDDQSDE